MAVFSTNQNRQLYVVTEKKDTPAAAGEYAVSSVDGKLFIKYFGEGGAMRSDLIDLNSIVYAKYTTADSMKTPLKEATITLADEALDEGKPISGQDYIVRIYIHNYLAPGDAHTTIKYGAVHATKSMTTSDFYNQLAQSLTKNFSREVQPLLTFIPSESGVKIEEVEQPWNLGTMSLESVNFEVVPTTITVDGDEVIWAELDDNGKIPVTPSKSKSINNGKKIADLEYFCMGERGDQYRNMGWPNVIPTKYMVDPSQEYDVIDIHYSFSDTGVNVQKSEKDITFVGSKNAMNALAAELKAKSVEVQNVPQQ